MILAIIGPTATGKTAVSLALARAIRAGAVRGVDDVEIINADAMQLYRGLDIGTAKVSPEVTSEVAHHLLDVLDVDQEASVAAYQRDARAAIASIRSRGNLPVVVGGSGLYVRALLDDIEFPGTDAAIRARLEDELATKGPEALHARLAEVDPVSAARLHPANERRIVRALEVFDLTGRPFSASMPQRRYVEPTRQFGLVVEPEVLAGRIEARTHAMWQAGLAAETARAIAAGWGRTASKATGYAQAAAYLSGELTDTQAREAITVATRRLARKQRTWFKADPRISWLQATGEVNIAPMLEACS